MSRSLILTLLAVAGLSLVLSAGAAGNGGRPPVFPPNRAHAAANVTCGQELTSSIVLSDDLDCSGHTSGPAVKLDKGVKFDLGSHTLTAATGQDGVVSAASNAVVTNGKIVGGYDGVNFSGAQGDQVTKLTIVNSSNGNVTLTGSGQSLISQNALGGPSLGVLAANGAGNMISQNAITGIGNPGWGVFVENEQKDVVSKNTISGFTSNAVATVGFEDSASSGDTYTGNTVDGGSEGFYLTGGGHGNVTATGNIATNAAAYGFDIEGTYNNTMPIQGPYATISKNKATNDAGAGFYSLNNYNSTWAGNSAANSGAGFLSETDFGSTWTGNSATGNGGIGFTFQQPYRYTIKGNSAISNVAQGFSLLGDSPQYAFTSFTGNTANLNGSYGFDSTFFAVLGAGNKAKGNTPYDCHMVTCPAGSTFASVINK